MGQSIPLILIIIILHGPVIDGMLSTITYNFHLLRKKLWMDDTFQLWTFDMFQFDAANQNYLHLVGKSNGLEVMTSNRLRLYPIHSISG